ncbi:hypothetical protein [Antarcticirhabdus aurantiaca]|uniref:Uncharacterized protein n=1 Tax=Antarcticirhabdus aurantiaca TaxID=2606717 RepID=A0ACD4NW84_9HYPH|nr:hypothetical protein [Antarcticirhabdus aurantiaca]WAJ31155.1 hypothetical protein OXU80_13530 [Jeongeuplla avenae]
MQMAADAPSSSAVAPLAARVPAAGGPFPSEIVMTQPEERHRRAAERAEKMDRKWFRLHPLAWMRLRDSVPFEDDRSLEEGHVKFPFTIVALDRDTGTIERRRFYAHQRPDSDAASLMALWDLIEELRAQDTDGVGRMEPSDSQVAAFEARRRDVAEKYPDAARLMQARMGAFG